MKEAVRAAEKIATDSAGTISQSFLSQVERGRKLSIDKIVTLCAVYKVEVETLIGELPRRTASEIRDEYYEWLDNGNRPPLAPDRLPHETASIDRQVARLISASAAPETRALLYTASDAQLRDAIAPFVVLPFLQSKHGPNAAREFWREKLPTTIAANLDIPESSFEYLRVIADWLNGVREFRDWLLYDHHAAEVLFSGIAKWSLDSWESGVVPLSHFSLRFRDAEIDSEYGIESVPYALAAGFRWRQCARLLRRHVVVKKNTGIPKVPDIEDGPTEYAIALCSLENSVSRIAASQFFTDRERHPLDLLWGNFARLREFASDAGKIIDGKGPKPKPGSIGAFIAANLRLTA